jgi:hypothetical protein
VGTDGAAGSQQYEFTTTSANTPARFDKTVTVETTIGSTVSTSYEATAQIRTGPPKDVLVDVFPVGLGHVFIASGSSNISTSVAVSLPRNLPDLIAKSLAYNDKGGISFSYKIAKHELNSPSRFGVYWSTSETMDGKLSALAIQPTDTKIGTYGPYTIAKDFIKKPPENAKFLLLVMDPDQSLAEDSEQNNVVALALIPDIELTADSSLSWNPERGGVTLDYEILGGVLPSVPTIDFYWSSNTSLNGKLALAGTATGARTPGSQHVDLLKPTLPPKGAKYLIAVADPPTQGNPDGMIKEASETNNVAYIAYDPKITFDSAKYDGNPDEKIIGRFLRNPIGATKGFIEDEVISVLLSDSLAALKPLVSFQGEIPTEGFVSLLETHALDGGTKYETDGFDPSNYVFLSGDKANVNERLFRFDVQLGGVRVFAEKDLPQMSIQVADLPAWISQLKNLSGSLENSSNFLGKYRLKGDLFSWEASGRIPADIPILSDSPTSIATAFALQIEVPLNVAIPDGPKVTAAAELRFQVGDLLSGTFGYDSIPVGSATENGVQLLLDPTCTLDPLDLTWSDATFSFRVIATETFELKGPAITRFGLSVTPLLPYKITTELVGKLVTKLELRFAQKGLGTYDFDEVNSTINTKLEVALKATLAIGAIIPLKEALALLPSNLSKILQSSRLVSIGLKLLEQNALEAALVATGTVSLGIDQNFLNPPGSPSANTIAVEGELNFVITATPKLRINGVNLLGFVPELKIQLFPTLLPKKFRYFLT